LSLGFGPVQAQQFSGHLYKEASRLGFREAENYVELIVPTCVPSLRGWRIETASPTFVQLSNILFCVKVLVIQVLSCFGVRLAVHHRVARWIHLFGVRFVYIDELLAGLTFPHL
jgi:hypothetical protein